MSVRERDRVIAELFGAGDDVLRTADAVVQRIHRLYVKMDKGRAHNGPLSAQGLRDLFEPSGRARDAQTLDKTRKIVYARRHAFSFPFQPETRWLMSRSFTEIITLMQRGA